MIRLASKLLQHTFCNPSLAQQSVVLWRRPLKEGRRTRFETAYKVAFIDVVPIRATWHISFSLSLSLTRRIVQVSLSTPLAFAIIATGECGQ